MCLKIKDLYISIFNQCLIRYDIDKLSHDGRRSGVSRYMQITARGSVRCTFPEIIDLNE